jgi:hypothetical protein
MVKVAASANYAFKVVLMKWLIGTGLKLFGRSTFSNYIL